MVVTGEIPFCVLFPSSVEEATPPRKGRPEAVAREQAKRGAESRLGNETTLRKGNPAVNSTSRAKATHLLDRIVKERTCSPKLDPGLKVLGLAVSIPQRDGVLYCLPSLLLLAHALDPGRK